MASKKATKKPRKKTTKAKAKPAKSKGVFAAAKGHGRPRATAAKDGVFAGAEGHGRPRATAAKDGVFAGAKGHGRPRATAAKDGVFAVAKVHSITPFLMYNANPEEAAKFYASIFKNCKILMANAMQADFILNGQRFFAYNGGPHFSFNWGVSFMVTVETQKEVDYYWNALTADGGKESMCGWVQDKFGLSWQITPKILMQLTMNKDKSIAERAMQAMLKMKKIDIAALKAAVEA